MNNQALDPMAMRTQRSHKENQERAYIAASRRTDRSPEARMLSAKRASDVHELRTGKKLKITEKAVMQEEMYEEEDNEEEQRRKRVNRDLASRCDRLSIQLGSSMGERVPEHLNPVSNAANRQYQTMDHHYPVFQHFEQSIHPIVQNGSLQWSAPHGAPGFPEANIRPRSFSTPDGLEGTTQAMPETLRRRQARASLPGDNRTVLPPGHPYRWRNGPQTSPILQAPPGQPQQRSYRNRQRQLRQRCSPTQDQQHYQPTGTQLVNPSAMKNSMSCLPSHCFSPTEPSLCLPFVPRSPVIGEVQGYMGTRQGYPYLATPYLEGAVEPGLARLSLSTQSDLRPASLETTPGSSIDGVASEGRYISQPSRILSHDQNFPTGSCSPANGQSVGGSSLRSNSVAEPGLSFSQQCASPSRVSSPSNGATAGSFMSESNGGMVLTPDNMSDFDREPSLEFPSESPFRRPSFESASGSSPITPGFGFVEPRSLISDDLDDLYDELRARVQEVQDIASSNPQLDLDF